MKSVHWHQSWQKPDEYPAQAPLGSPQSTVHQTDVNTNSFPESEQFPFWREYVAHVGKVSRPDRETDAFSARNSTFFTSTITYSHHSIDNPSSIKRTQQQANNAEFDTLAIQLRLAGDEVEHSFGRQRMFLPGDIRIIDFTKPFYLANNHYDTQAILIRKKDLLHRVPHLDNLHGVTLTESPMTALLRAHLTTVFNILPLLTNVEAEKVSDITLETLCASLLISAAPNAIESDLLNDPAMRTIRHYINEHMADSKLSPEQIALGVGMSRAKLFRLCKPYGTPMELVRHQRLKKARDLMHTRHVQSVEEAAYSVGYENRSSFSRAFQKEFGLSARDLLHSNFHC